jgi:hypothetical protein
MSLSVYFPSLLSSIFLPAVTILPIPSQVPREVARPGTWTARGGRLRPQPHRQAGRRVDPAAQAVGVLQRARLRGRTGAPAANPAGRIQWTPAVAQTVDRRVVVSLAQFARCELTTFGAAGSTNTASGDGYRRASLSATRLRSTSAGDGRAWFRS